MYQKRGFLKFLIGISTLLYFSIGAGATFAVDTYEPDDTSGTAGIILLSMPQDRDLDPAGDDDYVQFAAVAGERYVLVTSGTTITDTELFLYDLDGITQLAYNDDAGFYDFFSSIFWSCPETGTYYLKVSGTYDSTGAYTLSVNLDLSGSLSGTVYENDGRTPVTTGEVYAYTDPCAPSSSLGFGWIDADGTYTIQRLSPGNVYLRATSLNNVIDEWWAENASNPDCNLADAVSIAESASLTGIDFQLDPGARISGTVYESDGSTLITTGGYVHAYTGDPCGYISFIGSGWIYDDGFYSIEKLPAGNIYLQTDPYGNHITEWWAENASNPDCNLAEAVSVAEGASLTSINFQLDPGAEISGTVYESNGITPITGGTVYAYTGDPCVNSTYVGVGSIAENGTYTIQGLPAGNFYLRTNPMGNLINEWWAENASTPDCNLAETVPVAEGASASGIDFQLDSGAEISGTVYESNGITPITTAYGGVEAYTGNPCGGNYSYVGDGWIDENGTYTIQGLPAGNIYLFSYSMFTNHISEWWAENASTPDCNLAETVPVAGGVSVTNIDFQLNLLGDYTITVSSSPPEGGTISGGGTFSSGVTANLTAVPNAGYTFTGWSGDATGADNPLSVTVDTDKNITASFKKKGKLAFPIRAKDGTIVILTL